MCACCGVIVCFSVNLLNFVFSFLYLVCISLCSVLSIVLWMYCQVLFHVLARVRCRWYICEFNCCFLQYKNLISSLILSVGILCCVCVYRQERFLEFLLSRRMGSVFFGGTAG